MALAVLVACKDSVFSDDVRKAVYESYHVILMLDDGPIHARFGIALDGQPVESHREQFLSDLVEELDRDGDKRLSTEEANRSYILRRKISEGTRRFIKKRNLAALTSLAPAKIDTMFKQVAGQPVIFRQVNDSFISDEYIFGLIDEDGSGIIDSVEMTSLANRFLNRDADGDDCIGFDELQPPPVDDGADGDLLLGISRTTAPEEILSHAVFSELLRPASDRHLPQRMVNQYDRNGDGKLSPKELNWAPDRLKPIDANQDGELSRSELSRIAVTSVDIDLNVDVAPISAAQPIFRVASETGKRLTRTERPGCANLLLPEATVTLSYRHVDTLPEALENARLKFNALDADVNGYLEKEELNGEPLFQRELFDQMDTDDDAKVFGEEIDSYVLERARVKSMSCQVAMYDTGNGFFQALDHNNDGRISVRERRTSAEAMQSLERDATPGISKDEPVRSYHIEFSRGSFLLFQGGQEIARNSIAFNTQVSVGPAWFTGSDRNNDGDLTWGEFLGHREDFHFLDLDQDGLIDPIEALRAEELRSRSVIPKIEEIDHE